MATTKVSLMKAIIALSSLLVFSSSGLLRADFVGPSVADRATSPDGNLIVRVSPAKDEKKRAKVPTHVVAIYEYDAKKDAYIKRSAYRFQGYLGQMLYVSDAGDLAVISLPEKEAIRIYSREGKLAKTWDLEDFLTAVEIAGTAQTGSTLQWLEEGRFVGREFYFRGPSQLVRALRPSYTVMRGSDPKIQYSGMIDTQTLKLTRDAPRE